MQAKRLDFMEAAAFGGTSIITSNTTSSHGLGFCECLGNWAVGLIAGACPQTALHPVEGPNVLKSNGSLVLGTYKYILSSSMPLVKAVVSCSPVTITPFQGQSARKPAGCFLLALGLGFRV